MTNWCRRQPQTARTSQDVLFSGRHRCPDGLLVWDVVCASVCVHARDRFDIALHVWVTYHTKTLNHEHRWLKVQVHMRPIILERKVTIIIINHSIVSIIIISLLTAMNRNIDHGKIFSVRPRLTQGNICWWKWDAGLAFLTKNMGTYISNSLGLLPSLSCFRDIQGNLHQTILMDRRITSSRCHEFQGIWQ